MFDNYIFFGGGYQILSFVDWQNEIDLLWLKTTAMIEKGLFLKFFVLSNQSNPFMAINNNAVEVSTEM